MAEEEFQVKTKCNDGEVVVLAESVAVMNGTLKSLLEGIAMQRPLALATPRRLRHDTMHLLSFLIECCLCLGQRGRGVLFRLGHSVRPAGDPLNSLIAVWPARRACFCPDVFALCPVYSIYLNCMGGEESKGSLDRCAM